METSTYDVHHEQNKSFISITNIMDAQEPLVPNWNKIFNDTFELINAWTLIKYL